MNKLFKLTAAASVAALSTAFAGSSPASEVITPAAPPANGDWCQALKDFGKFYKNDSSPYIQELKFFGRFQWQAGTVDAEDFNGNDFDDDFTEVRRFRIGTQVKFLNHFKLKVNANLEDGGPNDHSFGYDGLDVAHLTYTQGANTFIYGRQKFTFGQESHDSSKRLKTVERSNLTNYFYGSRRPTGFTYATKHGDLKGRISIFSTDEDDELAQWGEGIAFYLNLQYACQCGTLNFDFLYNDADSSDVDVFDSIEWATSLAFLTKKGDWEILANILYGENFDGDAVYGIIIMPSTFLIEDKLEFVARYQFAGADNDMLRLTSRYARRADNGDGTLGESGDENHTFYVGLNWYLCGHASKFQFGVEYETLDQEDGDDADAITLWAAYRLYF